MRYRLRKWGDNGVFSAVMIMEKISHARVTTWVIRKIRGGKCLERYDRSLARCYTKALKNIDVITLCI